jgi:hypothetical protein
MEILEVSDVRAQKKCEGERKGESLQYRMTFKTFETERPDRHIRNPTELV